MMGADSNLQGWTNYLPVTRETTKLVSSDQMRSSHWSLMTWSLYFTRVITVWLNLTNESFTCPAHKLSSEVWQIHSFGATKREAVVMTTTTTRTAAAVAKSIWKKRKKMQPNRFQDAKPNTKNRAYSEKPNSHRWSNTCKGTQLMKKGRGGPYQPGEPTN